MNRVRHIPGLALARWLFSVFSDERYHQGIAGDCEELWQAQAAYNGTLAAHAWLWRQVAVSIPLFFWESFKWSLSMFKNYFKTTFRHLGRHKGYAAINIIGLSIGLACTFLILMWVQDELAYDRFHENLPRLYRAFTHQVYSGQVFNFRDTPGPLAEALETGFPEVERAITVLVSQGAVVKYQGRQYDEDGLCMASPGFFDLFTFPLAKGDGSHPLVGKASILITEENAKKYFGDDDPLGKTLTVNDIDFKVTGVLKNIPRHSHLQFDLLVPFENAPELFGYSINWHSNWPSTYMLLKPGVDADVFAEKIKGVIQAHSQGSSIEVWMQPVSKIWLYRLTGEKAGMLYVQIFSAVAFFVLLIACINFMNLSTAKAVNRAKEVGLRKVFGAYRERLIVQFYGESVLLAVMALLIAIVLVAAGLPLFNQLAGKEMTLAMLNDYKIWMLFVGVTLVTGFVAGSYPALVLSAFKPVSILGRRFTSHVGGATFRRALVIFQFTLSVILLLGTAVVREQIHFIRTKDLGYDNKNLLVVRLRMETRGKYNVIRSELSNLPGVVAVTGTDKLPISGGNSTTSYVWDGKSPDFKLLINKVYIDYDYVRVMGMTMAEGRDYSMASSGDINASYILNEEAIRRMDMEFPLGKSFGYEGQMGTIVGVIKDYHFMSLRNEIEPMVMMVNPARIHYLLIRLDSAQASATLPYIETVWKRINPGFEYEARFLDEVMSFWSRSEERTEALVTFFTLLAVVISSLGLLGLAAFMAQKRTREIGIRRVLGASTQGLVGLMSREFLILVLISNALAWPVAYWVMKRWLDNYAYHTQISWTLFAVAGVASMAIAFLSVSVQSVKAALSDPVQSLRVE